MVPYYVIPNTLEGWTFDIIDELTTKGESEGDTHDFKADIPDSVTLTKLCCAFANSRRRSTTFYGTFDFTWSSNGKDSLWLKPLN